MGYANILSLVAHSAEPEERFLEALQLPLVLFRDWSQPGK